MNVGIVEPAGVEGGRNGVDAETMKYLRTIQNQRASFYKMRLQDYLIIGEGQNKFPDYNNFTTRDGMSPEKSSKYSLPIVLNHTSRYGWAYNRYKNNGIPTYGEFDFLNPPCWGCQ
jgi:hypothetical protein